MLHRHQRDTVVVLTMDHGKANALDLELVRALGEVLPALEEADRTDAAVLTGAGTIFSAGVDLRRVLGADESYLDDFLPALSATLTRLFAFSKPLVAAVNGHAVAGGCVLACAADYRIATQGRGTIGVPELHVGVPFPYVALEVLRHATPSERLQELILLGRTHGMEEARMRGLVDELVAPDALLERACHVAARLGRRPRGRFAITKRQLRAPALDRIARHGPAFEEAVLAAWKDPATRDAIGSYVETTLGRG